MRFLPLVWSGIWRNPGRTVLVFLQATVAFALFGVLQGLKAGVDHAIAEARADLLLVHARASFFSFPLPVGLLTQIQALPGVKFADPVELFGGIYQNPSQKIGIVAVRPNPGWLSTFTFQVAPQYAEALRMTRTGTLIRVSLAKKYGWNIGDRIPLQTNLAQKNGSANWTFEVVGTYTDSDVGGGLDTILVNYDYVDEARATGAGTVQHINVAVTDPKIADTVADEIDRHFANSPNETETSSLRELAEEQMQSIGDLNFLIHAIVGTVLVALLFATATMLMQSTRERTPELAVLKAVGFSNQAVFLLILAEAIVTFCAAALCGLALATLVFPFAARFVHGISLPGVTVAIGLAFAVFAACASAALPALLAARIRVATALAAH
jgi:putative ABC transport system permease protein